jgi:hypothetical protein
MPVFPFTFSFPIPGFRNPWASAPTSPTSATAPEYQKQQQEKPAGLHVEKPPVLGRPFGPITTGRGTLAPPALDQHEHLASGSGGLKRSRGWSPYTAGISASPSLSTTYASSSGYLDTPAKYREMAQGIVGVGAGEVVEEEMNLGHSGDSRSRRSEKSGRFVDSAGWVNAELGAYEARSVGSTCEFVITLSIFCLFYLLFSPRCFRCPHIPLRHGESMRVIMHAPPGFEPDIRPVYLSP